MFDEVKDNRLANFLQRYILSKGTNAEKRTLHGITLCGSQALTLPYEYHAVYVVKNEIQDKTKFTNIVTCHSPWCCPRCSAIVLAKKGADIGAAIDALSTWYQLYPLMITFTIPHTKLMTCAETYTILQNTWRRMMKDGGQIHKRKYTLRATKNETENKSYRTGNELKTCTTSGSKNKYDQRAVGTKGDIREYIVQCEPFAQFRAELEIKYSVRVYEFTWGENSWHPHIHALFWTHKKNFKKIAAYEEKLVDQWWKYAKKETLKLWNKKHPDKKTENTQLANELYCDWRKYPKGTHRSLYISKTDSGEIRKISSSHYLAGWGGDSELTGSCCIKEAKNGHYTPFQLLELAYKDASKRDFYMKLFLEYAIATRGHRRIEFSKNNPIDGILTIIKKWRQSEPYLQKIKKKYMDKAQGNWQLVVWFTVPQWKQICYLDNYTDEEIRATILELARAPDGKELIEHYLQCLEIDISQNSYTKEMLAILPGVNRLNRKAQSYYDVA